MEERANAGSVMEMKRTNEDDDVDKRKSMGVRDQIKARTLRESKTGECSKLLRDMVGPNGLEPLTTTVSRKQRPTAYEHSPDKQST